MAVVANVADDAKLSVATVGRSARFLRDTLLNLDDFLHVYINAWPTSTYVRPDIRIRYEVDHTAIRSNESVVLGFKIDRLVDRQGSPRE